MIAVLYLCNATINSNKEIVGVSVYKQADIESIIAGKREATDIYHFPLKYEGQLLPYDWPTSTLYIPQNLNKKNYLGTIIPENGTLYLSENVYFPDNNTIINIHDLPSKKECILRNARFEMYLVDEDYYVKYNVIFTGMPVISLTYTAYDDETEQWAGTMELIDPYHSESSFVSELCFFHLRGDSTAICDKKSYAVNLLEKKSLLGLREDDDWALVAELGDNGFVHNKLCYDLWNKISKTNGVSKDVTVNSDYVEVFFDYNYVGLYNICEKVDRKLCDLKDGDYLYRLDRAHVMDDGSITHDYYLKYPKDATDEDYALINQFDMTFYSGQPVDYEYAKNIVNMNNMIDVYLYSMFTCAEDNWGKNAFYVAPKSDNYKISEIFWDMNVTFGNNTPLDYIYSTDIYIPHVKSLYYANPQEMSKLAYRRWVELRDSVITKAKIKGQVEEMWQYVNDSGSLSRETREWSEYINPDWKIDDMYTYIDSRIDFLDEYFKNEYEKYNKK